MSSVRWRGEFLSHQIKQCLTKNGISHQVSCPNSLQQNGKAKHKHHIIVEIGLFQLFHSQVSNLFWLEIFHTTVYILKRRPLIVLPNQMSPYFALCGKQLDYSSMRVFGYLCYPCLWPVTPNKFQSRSPPCVFLGYKPTYK